MQGAGCRAVTKMPVRTVARRPSRATVDGHSCSMPARPCSTSTSTSTSSNSRRNRNRNRNRHQRLPGQASHLHLTIHSHQTVNSQPPPQTRRLNPALWPQAQRPALSGRRLDRAARLWGQGWWAHSWWALDAETHRLDLAHRLWAQGWWALEAARTAAIRHWRLHPKQGQGRCPCPPPPPAPTQHT